VGCFKDMDETEIKGISNRSEKAWMLPVKIVLTYARSAIVRAGGLGSGSPRLQPLGLS
jgi:hypothetical protein